MTKKVDSDENNKAEHQMNDGKDKNTSNKGLEL